ncbi:hypothetical protein CHUAL_006273 [Chamberlinius hualienensis]
MYEIWQTIVSIFIGFFIRVLKAGNIPRHVAIIPDGNRRFAQSHRLPTNDGHTLGKAKMYKFIDWCKELGIEEVTFYVLAIRNLERSQEEVEHLLRIIVSFYEDKDILARKGIRYKVFGKLELLPKHVQRTMAKLVEETAHLTKIRVNLAIVYSSQEEIFNATKELMEGVEMGFIQPEDIAEDVFQKCLYTGNSLDPDLLIRTSGESRLSDFLLWQTSYSHLTFLSVNWPGIKLWHLFKSLMDYQRYYPYHQKWILKAENAKRLQENELIEKRIRMNLATNTIETDSLLVSEDLLLKYKEERQNRLNNFFKQLKEKRRQAIKLMSSYTDQQEQLSH